MNSSTTGISGAGGALAIALLHKLVANGTLTKDEAREMIGNVKKLFADERVRGAVDARDEADKWLKEF
jgi:polyhydroxyalkanoate synthesis regulator phasin